MLFQWFVDLADQTKGKCIMCMDKLEDIPAGAGSAGGANVNGLLYRNA